ncbi:hypothetical protein HMPREF0658_2291 [Hoylesella marshii DSM 16973 = JCM 13450]|uniref:Uncharacterized protein n=1 Tax=Hoylesella marshii DSM 16973 = JCM 13450 TaxID=862515 RepID=E0NVT6_9BACT|nr:hypothetical protein HMPREF0658_2291 [Hoylesella marshii DSM 16973 = JCM 13450]
MVCFFYGLRWMTMADSAFPHLLSCAKGVERQGMMVRMAYRLLLPQGKWVRGKRRVVGERGK